jgi:hypothetical protein
MNRPKKIGTAAESAVVKWLLAAGWPEAERLALRGSADHGDIRVAKGIHLEVKAGRAADAASLAQCHGWMDEAAAEGANAGVSCYLVVKRRGCGGGRAGLWRVFMEVEGRYRVETTLETWSDWMRAGAGGSGG